MNTFIKQARKYGAQAAQLDSAGFKADSIEIRRSFRAYLRQFEEDSLEREVVRLSYWDAYTEVDLQGIILGNN